jgi:hypothetical protein
MDKVICIVDGLDGFDFGKEYSMITAMDASSPLCGRGYL